MTLQGEMALVIVRQILAHPEKFSRGLAEAACRFEKRWKSSEREYWSRSGNIGRFPKDYIPWGDIQELLPEDFAERIKSLDTGDGK